MCKCNFCKLHRRVERTLKSGNAAKKNDLIRELADRYWSTSADLDYENAIKDGSWPQAVEILTERLERAKAKCAHAPENPLVVEKPCD